MTYKVDHTNTLLGRPSERTLNRFWSKVQVGGPEDCWPWLATKGPRGYGAFTLNSRRFLAHRISWSFANRQATPPDLVVMHACDNPPCVNPDHLQLGTRQDNTRDMIEKGRRVQKEQRGEAGPLSKLTAAEVREIRASYALGAKQADLSRQYSVSHGAIWSVVHGRAWTHV